MKKALTTFETAKILGLSPYTVRLWIIKGLMPAFKTPGGHRRIKIEELNNFLKKHRIPVSKLSFSGKWRALLVGFGDDREEAKRIKGHLAEFLCAEPASPVEEGFLLLKMNPQILLVDLDNKKVNWRESAMMVMNTPELSHVKVLGVSSNLTRSLMLKAEKSGVYDILVKPLAREELRKKIKELFGTLRF